MNFFDPSILQKPYYGEMPADAMRGMMQTQMGGEGMMANPMATAFAADNRFSGMNHNQGAFLPTIARWQANRRADERQKMEPKFAEQLLKYLGMR